MKKNDYQGGFIIKLLFKLMTVMVTVSTLIFVAGCEMQNTLAPDVSVIKTTCTDNGLTIIPIGKSGHSFNKIISKSKFITVSKGGTIHLDYDYDDGDAEVELQMSLQILPNAINQDTLLTLQIDDNQFLGEFGVDFSPHGIIFNQPAIFNIDLEIEDIDPSAINTSNLDIYYENTETGQWELMERDAIYVEVHSDEIEIEVVNAKLPHFSRYAIGAE